MPLFVEGDLVSLRDSRDYVVYVPRIDSARDNLDYVDFFNDLKPIKLSKNHVGVVLKSCVKLKFPLFKSGNPNTGKGFFSCIMFGNVIVYTFSTKLSLISNV